VCTVRQRFASAVCIRPMAFECMLCTDKIAPSRRISLSCSNGQACAAIRARRECSSRRRPPHLLAPARSALTDTDTHAERAQAWLTALLRLRAAQNMKKKAEVDYSDETPWREFAPARADLAFNVAMGFTLVWLPLTASAVGRCAFVKYRLTDKRIVVETTAPWKSARRRALALQLVHSVEAKAHTRMYTQGPWSHANVFRAMLLWSMVIRAICCAALVPAQHRPVVLKCACSRTLHTARDHSGCSARST
jgi:hypothetical protein